MLQAVVSFSKNSERVALTVLVVLVGIVSYGCVPVLSADIADKKVSSYEYVDQTQAFRVDEGMSLEQFNQEMWDYVPAQYSRVLERRIRDYVEKYWVGIKAGRAQSSNWEPKLKKFPELKLQYEAIQAKQLEYKDHKTFWDLKSMAYRAVRLRDGASEEVIIEELRQSDLFFNRRYELYQEKLSKESEGS